MEAFFITNLDLRNPDSFDSALIKKIERYVRNSYEYRKFCLYIRDEKGLVKCDYFKDIFSDEQDEITTEIHHNLFTLYDIVEIVGLKMIFDYTTAEKVLLPIDIAKKVIELHLENKVSVIVLSKSIHEAVHGGEYKYDQTHAVGNWKDFVKEYCEYISADKITKIKNQYDVEIKLEEYYEKEEEREE